MAIKVPTGLLFKIMFPNSEIKVKYKTGCSFPHSIERIAVLPLNELLQMTVSSKPMKVKEAEPVKNSR